MRGRTIGLAGALAALALPAPAQAATPQPCPDGAWEHQLLDLTGAGRSSALGFFAAGTKVAVETACRTGVPGLTYHYHLCVRGVGAALRLPRRGGARPLLAAAGGGHAAAGAVPVPALMGR